MAQIRNRVPAADRRQQIMQVAMELFAEQGFEGTTTRQIAQRARVNEAILFRHFPRKEELYWATIDHICRTRKGRQRLKDLLDTNGNDRQTFARIAEEILERNTRDTTLARLLLFSALEHHRLSHRFFRTFVAEYYEALAHYIRARINSGKFRRVDPLLAARAFLGSVVYHFLIQELFGGKRYQKFDRKRVSNLLTEIWLQGMLAPRGETSRSERSSKQR